jgi:hypothetical protein
MYVPSKFNRKVVPGKPRRIDTHAHIVPPFYREWLIGRGLTEAGMAIPEWAVEDHLAIWYTLDLSWTPPPIDYEPPTFTKGTSTTAVKIE